MTGRTAYDVVVVGGGPVGVGLGLRGVSCVVVERRPQLSAIPKGQGHLPPQPLSCDRRLFAELGSGFALLALDADDAAVESFVGAARAAGLPLTVVRDSFAGGREAYGCRLVLVRPDQFVAWTGDLAPADVPGLLAKVAGRR